jgi:hypothetical protein
MNSEGKHSTSMTNQVKAFMGEAVLRLEPLMIAMPAGLVRSVMVFVILSLFLVRLFRVPAGAPGTALITVLCGVVGVVAIAAYRRWSVQLAAGESALRWSKDHLWMLGCVALISVANFWLESPSFSHPVLPLIGLSLLIVGTQLFLRAFLVDYFLRYTGTDNLGIGVAVVLNALILSAFELRGHSTFVGWIAVEALVNYAYYKSPALLPVVIFFGAALAVPDSDGTVMAGLVAMATYYAVMIVSSLVARPVAVSGVSGNVGAVGTD